MAGTLTLRCSLPLKQDMMISKVQTFLEQEQLLQTGQWVILALSGGADSVALLSVCKELQDEYDLHLLAAHVNHGIRGEEADQDEAFCQSFCRQLNVDLRVLHADIPALAKQTGVSEETCGRKVRYQFFQDLAEELMATGVPKQQIRIATAHTAQDAVETMLFHLARGTGLTGLCGIPAARGNIIRPLLTCTRADIEAYLQERHLPHREDSTNQDISYARNRIRHQVLPALEACNDGALRNILRCMELLQQDEAYLEEQADLLRTYAKVEGKEAYYADRLSAAHPAVLNRVLASVLTEVCGQNLTAGHIAQAATLLTTGGQMQIPTGAYVRVRDNEFCVLRQLPDTHPVSDFAVTGAEEVTLPVGTFRYRVFPNPDRGLRPNAAAPGYACRLDFDKIGPFTLRNRRPGDRFTPAFRNVTKSLKSLFNEAGIPPKDRSGILLMESGGEIVWIQGFGPSESARVRTETETIMEIILN